MAEIDGSSMEGQAADGSPGVQGNVPVVVFRDNARKLVVERIPKGVRSPPTRLCSADIMVVLC
jgi:hypothetical protein